MPTTKNSYREYLNFAKLSFKLFGKRHSLSLFQNAKVQGDFFLPFTDITTGRTTYPSGRYVPVKIKKDNKLLIDFNLAFNPYCAYNKRFSCPIPPDENHLSIEITAGERNTEKIK